MAADEDLARQVLERERAGEPAPTPGPSERFSEWSPERDALARIEDLLGQLLAITIKAAGGTSRVPKPAPRPTSVVQRLREDDRTVGHLRLVRRLVPPTG